MNHKNRPTHSGPVRGAWLVSLVVLVSGCLQLDSAPHDPALVEPRLLLGVAADHDHRDPALHGLAANLELVSFLDAARLLGEEEARLSDLQFHDGRQLAAAAVNGRTGETTGGFLLFDASLPGDLRLYARYRSGSEDNWYVKFSASGNHVFLTANGGQNATPALAALLESARWAVATAPARGVHVVNVSDPVSPSFSSFFPAPVRVINLAPWVARDGSEWLFASVVNDRAGLPAPANHVAVLRFERGRLTEAARWHPAQGGATVLAHDLAVETHPVTGRDLLYAAYWEGGAYVLDVTEPATPTLVSHLPAEGPADRVHTFKPHPGLVGGRHLAVLAPETFAGEPSGTYRLVDVTDPAEPVAVANWTLPPGELANAESLLFSPHEFSLANGRLYASNYHGGAWVLDLATLRPVAAWQRALGDPARTGDWAVDVETAVWHGGFLHLVDMNAGLIALRESA